MTAPDGRKICVCGMVDGMRRGEVCPSCGSTRRTDDTKPVNEAERLRAAMLQVLKDSEQFLSETRDRIHEILAPVQQNADSVAPFHTCEIGVPDAGHPLRTDSAHCGGCYASATPGDDEDDGSHYHKALDRHDNVR